MNNSTSRAVAKLHELVIEIKSRDSTIGIGCLSNRIFYDNIMLQPVFLSDCLLSDFHLIVLEHAQQNDWDYAK